VIKLMLCILALGVVSGNAFADCVTAVRDYAIDKAHSESKFVDQVVVEDLSPDESGGPYSDYKAKVLYKGNTVAIYNVVTFAGFDRQRDQCKAMDPSDAPAH
jgi:hypothetical protein